jgi:hypothetical protein
MSPQPSPSFCSEERPVIELLNRAVEADAVRERIDAMVRRVAARMSEDRARPMAWEPVPLSVFGESLPSAIRSCWVFMLRAGVTTGAERHPNSHQRMMSYEAAGDLQTWAQGSWESHLLVSEARATLEQRWVSVPPNVWHQAVVPGQDWVVVSFHTVAAEELIEERRDPADRETIRQKRYILEGQEGTRSNMIADGG